MSISLVKGQRISLAKNDGSSLQRVCVGVNWGAIEKKRFFFSGTRKKAVDLDVSAGLFADSGNLVDLVYFGKLKSNCLGICHSGDDLTGDMADNDSLDNEVITLDLSKIDANIHTVCFLLNSFRGHDFKDIPYARIRIYEGTPTQIDTVYASLDLVNDAKFSGKVSMILGKLYRSEAQWKFHSIGQPTSDQNLNQTLETFAQKYL